MFVLYDVCLEFSNLNFHPLERELSPNITVTLSLTPLVTVVTTWPQWALICRPKVRGATMVPQRSASLVVVKGEGRGGPF